MTPPPLDLAASIRQRLLNLSQRDRMDFQLVLTRYAIERLLYRLSQSAHPAHFLLKGAMLFIAWDGWSPRPTRDVDLLGRFPASTAQLRAMFEAICRTAVEPDGLVFAPESVTISDIREAQAYGGKRVRVRAALGQARVEVQVDIGFGDVVTSPPARIVFPTLLALPAPTLLAYPRETVVAETFEAVVRLGLINSRMKDFYDLALIARAFAFEGPVLADAIRATCARRATSLPAQAPAALTPAFTRSPRAQTQWAAFARRTGLAPVEPLESVGEFLQTFLMPPVRAVVAQQAFSAHWPPGGPWG